jgi:apolipoprotein D and lipocalin family protein
MAMKGLIIFLTTLFFLLGCATTEKLVLPPLQVVPRVDLRQYTGTWFEIARYPNRFQDGCAESSATYTLLEDGTVGVLNQCRKMPGGETSSVKGKARIVDKKTNAKLKVSFFWPFSGDYWIIDLGEKYDYAAVGHPTRKYLWILSRTMQMEESLYQKILVKLRDQGYDTQKLIRTECPVRDGNFFWLCSSDERQYLADLKIDEETVSLLIAFVNRAGLFAPYLFD